MKQNRKKKRSLLKGYTGFQKFWIILLLVILAISLILTLFQGVRLLLGTGEEETSAKKTPKSTDVSIVEAETTLLQQTEDAGKEYVNETLFLGDSNTVRFMNFTDDEGETYTTKDNTIAVVGMGVNAIDSLECMEFSTGTFTMVDSVKILQPRRIIITFGTNNLTGNDSDSVKTTFIEDYTKQLQELQDAYPTVDIIVNSIPPISETTVYTNLDPLQIMHWNEAIEKMCEENGWHYLNSSEVLADATTGYALDGMMDTDGLHLSKEGIKTLFTYIRTHAYITEDDRGTLLEIPTIIGPMTTLYTVDPLSGNSFDESVLHPTDSATPTPETSTSSSTPETPTPTPVTPTPTPATPTETTETQETTGTENTPDVQSPEGEGQ